MAIKIKSLEHITKGLGYICVFWAWLESGVDEMLEALIPLEEGKLSQAVTASLGFREKIKLTRAIAFIKNYDDDWFKKLDALLNEIDNDIRPERNRLVHDAWFKPKGRLTRRTRQIKFKKPEAFALELSTEERTPVKMSEVWKLARRILQAQIDLVLLMMQFRDIQKYIDTEVQKWHTEQIMKETINALATLREKSSPQEPHPPPRETRPRNKRSRRKRPPQS